VTEVSEASATKASGDGVDIRAVDTAIETAKSQPSDVWLVAGSDDLVALLMASAREVGVTVSRLDGAAEVERGAILIVELPGEERETTLQTASKAGAFCVAVLDEPTIGTFAKVVRGGARDVLAGKPTAEVLSSRIERWKARGKTKKS
jgi:hypothetical protein